MLHVLRNQFNPIPGTYEVASDESSYVTVRIFLFTFFVGSPEPVKVLGTDLERHNDTILLLITGH